MFLLEDYNIFRKKVQDIIDDTFESEPNEEDLKQNRYFIRKGLWEGTEDQFYVYHMRKIPPYKNVLLSLCKELPKFHEPCEEHGGTISYFDLLLDPVKCPGMTERDMHYQVVMANHFINLLEASGIGMVHEVEFKDIKGFLIVINPAYREYMER